MATPTTTTPSTGLRVFCPICLDKFGSGDGIVSIECGHVFHVRCLDEWKKRSSTCATCRRPTFFQTTLRFATEFEEAEQLARRAFEEQMAMINESFEEKMLDLRFKCDTAVARIALAEADADMCKERLNDVKAENTRLRMQLIRMETENNKVRLENGQFKNKLRQFAQRATVAFPRERPTGQIAAPAVRRPAVVSARPIFLVPTRRRSTFPPPPRPPRPVSYVRRAKPLAQIESSVRPFEPSVSANEDEEDVAGTSGLNRLACIPKRRIVTTAKRPNLEGTSGVAKKPTMKK